MYIGIDLGTCNTLCAGLNTDGTPILIPDSVFKEYLHTPSIAQISGRQALAGAMAEMAEEVYPNRVGIRYFKRHFGDGSPMYLDADGREWFAETLAAMLLKKVRFDAELFGMDTVQGAVITVPAHFNDAQRRSVLEAAKLADLPLLGMLDEPVAAALYYGHQAAINDQLVLIYDIGGGTFDLTLLTRSGNTLHVLAKDGISNLGGKEFDEMIMDDMLQQCQKTLGTLPDLTAPMLSRLSRTAEKLKIASGEPGSAEWRYEWIGLGGNRMFEYAFSRQIFEEKLSAKMALTAEVLQRCLDGLGIAPDMLHKVILVGGGAKLPYVRQYLEAKIPALQGKVDQYEPMQAIAKGAALYASNLVNGTSSLELKSVSTYNIAIDLQQSNHQVTEAGHYDKLILKNTPLPVSGRRTVRFLSNGQDRLRLKLVQFWDEQGEAFDLGALTAGPFESSSTPLTFELSVENRINGTIGLKLLQNGQDVPIAFRREKSGRPYQFSEQKAILDNVVVNNVF
jgi:molecular chaperone DnaK (HSP70)